MKNGGKTIRFGVANKIAYHTAACKGAVHATLDRLTYRSRELREVDLLDFECTRRQVQPSSLSLDFDRITRRRLRRKVKLFAAS